MTELMTVCLVKAGQQGRQEKWNHSSQHCKIKSIQINYFVDMEAHVVNIVGKEFFFSYII